MAIASPAGDETLRGPLPGKPTPARRPSSPAPGSQNEQQLVALDFDRLQTKGILTPDQGRSTMAEEYRIIKRPLLLNASGQGVRPVPNGNLIMVTSAFPKEGKTFTAINLAMSLATEPDYQVILVDGDVAKPSIARIMEFRAKGGLIDYLIGGVRSIDELIIRTNVPKLSILPSGRQHHHSTELLASEYMRQLLREWAQATPEHRIIVFDSPPLLVTTEARELARHMGQIIMVVESDSTPKHAVREALSQLDNLEIVGMVLNKIKPRRLGGYYGYGGYGYGGYGYAGYDRDQYGGGGYGGGGYGDYGGYGGGYSGDPKRKRGFWKRLLGL